MAGYFRRFRQTYMQEMAGQSQLKEHLQQLAQAEQDRQDRLKQRAQDEARTWLEDSDRTIGDPLKLAPMTDTDWATHVDLRKQKRGILGLPDENLDRFQVAGQLFEQDVDKYGLQGLLQKVPREAIDPLARQLEARYGTLITPLLQKEIKAAQESPDASGTPPPATTHDYIVSRLMPYFTDAMTPDKMRKELAASMLRLSKLASSPKMAAIEALYQNDIRRKLNMAEIPLADLGTDFDPVRRLVETAQALRNLAAATGMALDPTVAVEQAARAGILGQVATPAEADTSARPQVAPPAPSPTPTAQGYEALPAGLRPTTPAPTPTGEATGPSAMFRTPPPTAEDPARKQERLSRRESMLLGQIERKAEHAKAWTDSLGKTRRLRQELFDTRVEMGTEQPGPLPPDYEAVDPTTLQQDRQAKRASESLDLQVKKANIQAAGQQARLAGQQARNESLARKTALLTQLRMLQEAIQQDTGELISGKISGPQAYPLAPTEKQRRREAIYTNIGAANKILGELGMPGIKQIERPPTLEGGTAKRKAKPKAKPTAKPGKKAAIKRLTEKVAKTGW